MIVVDTFAAARAGSRGSVGLVPTMGFLHEGHLACIEAARSKSDSVVVSVFVNPLQFEDGSDLESYPRDLERDLALVEPLADVVFAPDVTEMYPVPPAVRVHVGGVGDGMEGAHRPGHFEGVATVVAKLFAGIQPDRAAFGKKDAQQLAVVTAMTRDLSFPVEIFGVPTVRENDGLALSSRNVFISDREAALSLSRGLFAAADAAELGERRAPALEEAVANTVIEAGADLDYATLADAATASPIDELDRSAFLAVAARVGQVRLIDNVFLEPDGTADRGTRLGMESVLERH